jgi:hypothetical protein
MKRLLAGMTMSIATVFWVSGCGSDAGFDAGLVLVSPATATAVIGSPGATFNTSGMSLPGVSGPPVVFKVIKNLEDNDTTPVPDVDVELDISGFTALGQIYVDSNLSGLAGDGFHWKTRTNDQGVVTVYPVWTLLGCGAATEDIVGTVSVTATISTDQEVFSMGATIDCA